MAKKKQVYFNDSNIPLLDEVSKQVNQNQFIIDAIQEKIERTTYQDSLNKRLDEFEENIAKMLKDIVVTGVVQEDSSETLQYEDTLNEVELPEGFDMEFDF